MRLPEDQCQRIYSGEQPVKVWREFRELEVTDLRRDSKISVERISQIESGKGRRITGEEARKLARALDVALHALTPHHEAFRGCSALDVDEEEILARESDTPAHDP